MSLYDKIQALDPEVLMLVHSLQTRLDVARDERAMFRRLYERVSNELEAVYDEVRRLQEIVIRQPNIKTPQETPSAQLSYENP